MPTSQTADFPEDLHTTVLTTEYSGTALGNSTQKHSEVHEKVEREIYATQEKLGIGDSSPTNGTVLKGNGAGSSSWVDGKIMVPQLTTTERDAIASPSVGMLIFNTTNKSYEYYGDTEAPFSTSKNRTQWRDLQTDSLATATKTIKRYFDTDDADSDDTDLNTIFETSMWCGWKPSNAPNTENKWWFVHTLSMEGDPYQYGVYGSNWKHLIQLAYSFSDYSGGLKENKGPEMYIRSFKYNTGPGSWTAWERIRSFNHLTATTNPGVGDDVNDGFHYGSIWANTSTQKMYTCVDPTAGAAVWREIGVVVASNSPSSGKILGHNGTSPVWQDPSSGGGASVGFAVAMAVAL